MLYTVRFVPWGRGSHGSGGTLHLGLSLRTARINNGKPHAASEEQTDVSSWAAPDL